MRKKSYTFEEYNQEREAVIKESQYKEKYKNALKEIREILKKEDYCIKIENCEFCSNAHDCFNRVILNIINEAIPNEN